MSTITFLKCFREGVCYNVVQAIFMNVSEVLIIIIIIIVVVVVVLVVVIDNSP